MSEEPAKNPNWTREETLLGLDLYLRHRPRLLDEEHPEVMALSGMLRRLAELRGTRGKSNFRNPNGVAMKLGNLSSRDPEGPEGRKGLDQGAKAMQAAVWAEFETDPPQFQADVTALRDEILASFDAASADKTAAAATDPRVFVTGFWGFKPADEGYVGFTHQSTRDRLLAEWRDGDLLLVVGVQGQHTLKHDVGRCLGIVEIEPRPIMDHEGASPAGYRQKVEKFGTDRWKFAVPIRKAWFVGREVKARYVAPETCSSSNARAVATSYRQLNAKEAATACGLPLRKAELWGQPDWIADPSELTTETTAEREYRRGPAPNFGTFTTVRTDGDTCLYLMVLEGPIDAMFPRHLPAASGRAVVKVGRSNDPKARCEQLNSGFPPHAGVQWKLSGVQRFDSADEAHAAEGAALEDLKKAGMSLGKEFGLVAEKDLLTYLARYAGSSSFRISA